MVIFTRDGTHDWSTRFLNFTVAYKCAFSKKLFMNTSNLQKHGLTNLESWLVKRKDSDHSTFDWRTASVTFLLVVYVDDTVQTSSDSQGIVV